MKFHELKTMLDTMTRQEANALADAAKVPCSTLQKIRKGQTEMPRINTVESLIAAIQRRSRKSKAA